MTVTALVSLAYSTLVQLVRPLLPAASSFSLVFASVALAPVRFSFPRRIKVDSYSFVSGRTGNWDRLGWFTAGHKSKGSFRDNTGLHFADRITTASIIALAAID